MGIESYFVAIDGDKVARYLSLETALILVKALFTEYYNDVSIVISIARELDGERKGGEYE